MWVMDYVVVPDEPASAYLRAVVAALGPNAGLTSGFTWPAEYLLMDPRVVVCVGLGGTHVLFWHPFAGWFVDRIDERGCMAGEAVQLVSGALVPRPEKVAAAVLLFAEDRLAELPLRAVETQVPAGTRLTGTQQYAVMCNQIPEEAAWGLAAYTAAEATRLRHRGAGDAVKAAGGAAVGASGHLDGP